MRWGKLYGMRECGARSYHQMSNNFPRLRLRYHYFLSNPDPHSSLAALFSFLLLEPSKTDRPFDKYKKF